MNWNNIISDKRTGYRRVDDIRTDYQRDYDRLIFSSAFRRLQDKTQIFALPGKVFVHNRLTHSLETASVGRSLGKMIGQKLLEKGEVEDNKQDFYRSELQNVVAAACLSHDIGNPPFGHSGEEAFSNFFLEQADTKYQGKMLKEYYNNSEWQDLIHFEGNANSFRILTHQFKGKPEGGYRLTYTTLASMIKYPCSSTAAYASTGSTTNQEKNIHTKKYSFFQADQELATEVMDELQMVNVSEQPTAYLRHPFVYLTEAADDICYRIVDFEDAHRLNILSYDIVAEHFLPLIKELGDDLKTTEMMLDRIEDANEKVSFLRAKVINQLIIRAVEIFMKNSNNIIKGEFNVGLLDHLENNCRPLANITEISRKRIYNHKSVVQFEIAGFKVVSDLLSLFIPAILKTNPDKKDEKALYLLPEQFQGSSEDTPYQKTLFLLDYLSGMTDSYIIDIYRKLFGTEIPKHD